jgi:PAS domain S-box-containing protein
LRYAPRVTRTYEEEEIRELVETFEHPMVVTRGASLVIANQAWLKARGFQREDVEGKPIANLLAVEERQRLMERTRMTGLVFDKPVRTIGKRQDGSVVPIRAYSSRFPAREPPEFRVTLAVSEEGFDLAFGRELLTLATELIDASTEAEVRERTIAAFARAGLAAIFWRKDDEPPAGFVRSIAADAIAQHIAIFAGADTSAEAVYVAVGEHEVLYVTGPSLTGHHAYAFRFCGKLIATALLDVHASDAARRKLSDTQLLLQLARTTSGTLDLETVMSLTADSLVQLLDVSSCFILLHDEKEDALHGGASSHGRRDRVKEIVIPMSDPKSISARAARERRVIAITDTRRDDLARDAPLVSVFDETALCALPIVTRGRLEGVVVLDETRGPREFSPEWVELATAMIGQVGLSIANARLYESLRQSYEEVAHARAEMVKRERLAGLGELAATVAHEVRNPLGVIFNATTSLSRMVKSTEGATLVGIVREECERLNQIVGDLLDFARPKQLTMQRDDIGRVLVDVADSIAKSPNVRVEIAVAENLPLISVDRRLMRQAILNVTLNAVQAMPRGGTVTFRAAVCPEETDVLVAIDDDGPGIAEEDMPRIFEPFFTTKATGAGLGLAVVKRIVEDHGGAVTVKSSKKGTTFCFRLPLPHAS